MTEEPFGRFHTIRIEPSTAEPRTIPPLEGDPVHLGQITCPSGTVAVVDVTLGMLTLAFEAHEHIQDAPILQRIVQASEDAASIRSGAVEAIVLGGVPKDVPLHVCGVRMAGDAASWVFWEWVYLDVRPGAAIARSEYLGSVGTDYSRLMFGDFEALREWHQIESMDRLADLIIWGRNERDAAKEVGAPTIWSSGSQGFGWRDVPSDEAEVREGDLKRLCAERGWRTRVAARQHTHSYLLDEQIFTTDTQAATLDVGGARFCGWRTGSQGDDFSVVRDLDSHDQLVRVRVYRDADH